MGGMVILVNEWTFYLMHGLAYAGVATFYGASVYLVVTGGVYVARRDRTTRGREEIG
jgi:hypothetical protein